MANFKPALDLILANEGGYVNNSNDSGKETINGITREYNPDWVGWAIIDKYKQQNSGSFKESFLTSSDAIAIYTATCDLYKVKYWTPLRLNEVVNQDVADILFDFGINIGIVTIIQIAQRVINVLSSLSLEVDGVIGKQTLSALNVCIKKETAKRVALFITILVGSHYISLTEKYPKNETFIRGWINRTTLERKQ